MSSRKISLPTGPSPDLYTPEALAAYNYDEVFDLLIWAVEWDPSYKSEFCKIAQAELRRRDAAGESRSAPDN